MTKKIFTNVIAVVCALVFGISNAWADSEVIFSMTPSVEVTEEIADGATFEGSTFATVVGGKVTYQNDNTKAYPAVKSSMFYIGTSSAFFMIELDKALATGDVISIASMPATSNGANGLYIGTSSSDKSLKTTEDVTANVTFVVPASLDGAKTIYLNRVQGKTTTFSDITITRGSGENAGGDGDGENAGDNDGDNAGEDNPGEAIDPAKAYLLWDYTETAPSSTSDNGLTMASTVNDAAGTKNGLKGVKMNSSGYAYFTKLAVAGTLKLTFGARDGNASSALDVFTFTSEPKAETLVATTKSVTELSTVSIDLTAQQNNIYIKRNTSNEQVLTKIEFVPTVSRSFQDFEINLVNLSAPFDAATLPAGVVLEGSNRGDAHGYDNFKLTVPVDGSVKVTIGGCQYSGTPATIVNAAGETLATIDVKTPGCYHNGGVATWIYAGGADVLTINGAQYTPYVKVEAVEVQSCVVTFKDQNGNVIGTKDAFEGDALGEIAYSEKDLTIPEGYAFRGWFYASSIKANAADALTGNTTITALVTPIESVALGTVQNYNFNSNIFYPEDHETVSVANGYFHDSQHGWAFATDGTVSVQVAGNAQIVLSLCQYSKDAAITVTDANGNVVETIASGKVETDGSQATVNYLGEATTLTFTFTQGESYLHKIVVYNVEDVLAMDEKTGYYIVPSGDAAALLLAINSANGKGDAKIFLPNGTYDLGETVSTTISASNISLIGESAEGVIIKNAPNVKLEGLGKADLLLNTSNGLYMQDITLQNALDYYASGSAGRACSLHDQGKNTIAKNVRLLSYQDTYYSHKDGSYFYWEGGEIHGTVDYICGGGNVFFNGVTLVNESRTATGNSGDCTITAAYTADSDKGYVFSGCDIVTNSATFNLGRSWNKAKTVYLNTTIQSGKLADSRWTLAGMNSSPVAYYEYNTIDKSGNGKNSPESYVANFTHNTGNATFETILSAEGAEAYAYDNFFNAGWNPKSIAEQAVIESVENDAIYLVEKEGKFVALALGADIDSSCTGCTIRKANARGGFGEPVSVDVVTAINSAVNSASASAAAYNVAGQKVNDSFRGIIIQQGKKMLKK